MNDIQALKERLPHLEPLPIIKPVGGETDFFVKHFRPVRPYLPHLGWVLLLVAVSIIFFMWKDAQEKELRLHEFQYGYTSIGATFGKRLLWLSDDRKSGRFVLYKFTEGRLYEFRCDYSPHHFSVTATFCPHLQASESRFKDYDSRREMSIDFATGVKSIPLIARDFPPSDIEFVMGHAQYLNDFHLRSRAKY